MSTNKRVFFPYGDSNIENIISDGAVFVDKTNFIALLEEHRAKFAVFLRPRRFGKSLYLSVLEYYYDVKSKEKFEKIFSGYYIGKNPTKLASSFRILKFDFSGIDTRTAESTYSGFLEKVRARVMNFCDETSLTPEKREFICSRETPEQIIDTLFTNYPKNEPPIYLLIDEYDHFTNEMMMRSLPEFVSSVSKNGYVRKFYETVKTATQSGVVNRFFITGVSPITLDALTSGFNISVNLSLEPKFHDLMGFTETEVRELLRLVLADKSREEEVIETMRVFYNGYRFHKKAGSLYNSDMVLYFLKHFAAENEYPEQMLDENIAPDYGKLKMLFERLNWADNKAILENVLREGEISARIVRIFNFEHKPLGYDEFVSFLFYLGNLTIKGENELGTPVLKIPNRVIEELYWQYYGDVLQSYENLPPYTEKIRTAAEKMALGNHEAFFDLIQSALSRLSNRDFQKFDEKYVKMLIIAYAMLSEIFFVQTERELPGVGYVDLEFGIQPRNLHRPHYQYVFEIKYLRKQDKKLFAKEQKEAEMQLRNYLEKDEKLRNTPKLRAFTIVVVKDVLYLKELER
jgi:hypothetical protein